MEVYATEEQQLEAIKNWFKKNGNAVLWAITIVLLIIAALRYWFHHQTVLRDQASDHYLSLMTALDQKDETTLKSQADTLITRFAKSPYATFASFALTQNAVNQNELDEASKQLQWVMDHGERDFQALARIRLMRLWVAQNKLDEALALYDQKKAGAFLTIMDELKGDILANKQDFVGARKAYEQAVIDAPEEGMYGPLLKMKLEDLGGDLHALNEEKTNENKTNKEKINKEKTEDKAKKNEAKK
ncbi:MAG: YfgM family protein [Candidatus Berkiellales bacterium]